MSPDAADLYVALISDGSRLGKLRRLQYRCNGHRCLLLDAIEVPLPQRVLIHQKRYKLSASRNAERSSEAGRRANTYDGQNHWRERSYFIGTSALDLTDAEGATLELQCDHVTKNLLPSEFRAAWLDGRAEERVRADGTSFGVR